MNADSESLEPEPLEALPGWVQDIHTSLRPFLKNRQEATQIRRLITSHLSSHLISEDKTSIPQPISLCKGANVGSASSGPSSVWKECLRCIRANTKAREEYQKVKEEHQHAARENNVSSRDQDTPANSLALFLDGVKYRRKHERLRILQDYLDMLARQPAVAADHLDPQVVFRDFDTPPSVPSGISDIAGMHQDSQRAGLNKLVEQLEKSVLRAKLLLKGEQRLLGKVSADVNSHLNSPNHSGSRSRALGTARNELIQWIELELAKAGDSPDDPDKEYFPRSTETVEDNGFEIQLSSIQRQYAQYTKVREAFVFAAEGSTDASVPISAEEDSAAPGIKAEVGISMPMSHLLHPYLEELVSIANQHKSIIQQKSHLIISLAKQLKEAGQGLDRLADESHLRPAYPLRNSQQKASKISLAVEGKTTGLGKLDSSHEARAWVHACEASSKATKEHVAEKLEDGGLALLEARQTLSDLQFLLGENDVSGMESRDMPKTFGPHSEVT